MYKMPGKTCCYGGKNGASSQDKWRYTFYTAILFMIIASPFMFKIVNSILGSLVKICDKNGCPTTIGLVLHTIVFALLLRLMMNYDI